MGALRAQTIRPFLPREPALAGAVLRILLRAIRATLRRTSPGAGPDARLGAVSYLHRFGSALNPHFHLVVLDGVFTEQSNGAVGFHEATHLQADDAHALQRTIPRRVLRLFQRRGLLDAHTVTDMLTWQAAGGFNLDASVHLPASVRAGRERLLRYCPSALRPRAAPLPTRTGRNPALTGPRPRLRPGPHRRGTRRLSGPSAASHPGDLPQRYCTLALHHRLL